MKSLSRTLAAAVISGAALIGTSAIAQDASNDIPLTDDQSFAIELARTFNQCIADGMPAYQQDLAAVQQQIAQAQAEYESTPEYQEYQRLEQMYNQQAMTIANERGYVERIQQALANQDQAGALAVMREAEAVIMDELGMPPQPPAPVTIEINPPVHPGVACNEDVMQTLQDAGKTVEEINTVIIQFINTYGPAEFESRIAPSAPQP